MFHTLLLPLDGSDLAERALPYAVRLAQASQGRLILMRAAIAPPPARIDGAGWEREQLEAVQEAEAYVQRLAESISGVNVEVTIPYGRAAHAILETVDKFKVDAVVMATHGRTGLAHLIYGSVTEAVLASSSVPVLVLQVRPGEAPQAPFDPAKAHLLAPLDGMGFDNTAVRTAVEALGPWGDITLVSVVAEPDHLLLDDYGRVLAYLDQQEEACTREARLYLNTIAQELRSHGLPIRIHVDVRVGEPADGIAMAAIDTGADLIVMATHGRTGIRRAVMGSVAGAVLKKSSTPVLLVHPQPVASPDMAQSDEKPKAFSGVL
jgi:nucleotide-binding universal stress UspA family protein